jgi:Ca2+-binding EF-hand superfamily protein
VEKEIESLKKQFASTLQFSVIGAMRLFDQRGRGTVSLPEFQESCHKLLSPCKNPYLLNSQTYQIFRRFDRDNDGYLNYEEFAAFILPGADEKLSHKIASRNDYSLSEDSFELLVRLIKTMISMNGSHEFLRNRLRKSLEK